MFNYLIFFCMSYNFCVCLGTRSIGLSCSFQVCVFINMYKYTDRGKFLKLQIALALSLSQYNKLAFFSCPINFTDMEEVATKQKERPQGEREINCDSVEEPCCNSSLPSSYQSVFFISFYLDVAFGGYTVCQQACCKSLWDNCAASRTASKFFIQLNC